MHITKRSVTRYICRLNSAAFGATVVVLFMCTMMFHEYMKTHSILDVFRKEVRQSVELQKASLPTEDGHIPTVNVKNANCEAIINNSQAEINRTLRFMTVTTKRTVGEQYYLRKTENCSEFLDERKYIREALSTEEANFGIAYSIMIYKDIEQFERLLRAIYRPQNYYCVHVDKKSPEIFHLAIESILHCFPNVFMASTLVDVRWGEISALEPDLICMKDLWKRYKTWKYFINLTGQEFPLRTNNELVKILKSYKGTADIKKTKLFVNTSKDIQARIYYRHKNGKRTKRRLRQLSYDLNFTKGQCHVVIPRSFVAFTQQSWLAKDFFEWLRHTGVPDETYFQTLNNSPQLNIPGTYTGNRPRNARYKNWGQSPCHGKFVRGICIPGIADLHHITNQPQFFVNKFHLDFQYLTLECMEEWFYNRTRAYYRGDKVFDVTPYIYHENVKTIIM